jgi:ribonuclease J
MSTVEVIALGGVGEIGKNCTAVRQGDDIVVIDCGLSFPNEEMLGVDIVIPDFTYLLENKDKIRGVFITHAHEDHVGGLPYLLNQIKVPLYVSEFTKALIEQKLDEKIGLRNIDIRTFTPGDIIPAGKMSVEPVRITHSIPETCCMAVRTEHGIVFFTADFKFDFTPVDNKLSNLNRIAEMGEEGIVLLLSDSTNVERTGWGPSEREVTAGLRSVMSEAKGRVLLTTFASNIHRMQQFCHVAHELGRRVAVVGRRMEQNLETCRRLGYIQLPKDLLIPLKEVYKEEDDKVAILTTGSQGEPMSALVQMSKATYGRLQLKTGDTLLYSARPIPGNEGAIWRTINRLFDQGCRVIYDHHTPIHVSGHAYQEELKMMINITKPFYLAPVHGEPRHQFLYNKIAMDMGYPEHRLFTMKDGIPLVLSETSAGFGEPVPYGRVLIDNGGNPGVTEDILRDRRSIGSDGIVLVTVAVDTDRGEVVGEPTLVGKGIHGPDGLFEYAESWLIDALKAMSKDELKDTHRLRHEIMDVVRRAIQKRASLRPVVVPAIIEV